MRKRTHHTTAQKKGLLFLSFFVFATTVFAQSYAFKNYTTNDGLVQTDITAITQDKRGNIWIGTNGGISIFNGKKFTNYDDHDVLQSLRINALLCDSDGTMWVATGNGLLRYTNGFKVFFKPDSVKNSPVTSLTTNSQNVLLFVSNSVLYSVKNNVVEKYRINNSIESNAMFAAYDADDRLWIVTNDMRIYRKAGNMLALIKTPFTTTEEKHGLGMIRILGKEGPVPYFVTNFGAYWVQDDSLHHFAEQYPQFGKARVGQATFVLEENDSTIWAGGVVGLSKLTGSSTTRFTKENGFCDNSVSCIFTDKEKNIWIGCTYNGVYKLSNEALFHLNPSNESTDLRHITAILPLSPRQTLLATWGKGLFLYDGDTVRRLSLFPYVRYITAMLPVGDDVYIGWFGGGLLRLNSKTFAVSKVTSFAKDEAIQHLYKAGPNLVIQTLNRTCYLTDHNLRILASIKLEEDDRIVVLKDKLYRIHPLGRVDLLDNQLKEVKSNLFPGITSRITDIVCYRDNFLIGTFGQGLHVYSQWGKLLKKVDKKSGLNTNIVTSLLADGSHLFIGSNLGLIKADLPELKTCKVFTEDEGMFNWECRQDGLQKMMNGGIMIATTNGPYIYYPAKDATVNNTGGTLTIASFVYGDDEQQNDLLYDASSAMQLPNAIRYNDNDITVTLNGVSQRAPADIIYHYQLQGYDSMWISSANPVIKFGDLEPGDYRLRAYITVGDFVSKQLSVRFSIDKPLSGKLWFQALLVLALSVLCWALLTVGNRIYQKYIQTKMMGKLEADVALKQTLTGQAILFAQANYTEFSEALKTKQPGNTHLDTLTPLFLKDISNRIDLLWKQDTMTLKEFHNYFDELIAGYHPGAKVYHKISSDAAAIYMPASFHLLQVFSLYLFIGLFENGSPVFSLDSENKSNGHLLFRFYRLNRAATGDKACTYQFLKEAIERQQPHGVTIDVIENLEFGNMLIAELPVHNKT